MTVEEKLDITAEDTTAADADTDATTTDDGDKKPAATDDGTQQDTQTDVTTDDGDGTEGDAPADDGKEKEPSDYLPDDWRAKEVARLGLTGDAFKKAEEIAKRASTPAELLRRVMSADSKITEVSEALKTRVKLPTGKKDDPKDIEAFNKAWGVPDAADKYAMVDPPEELGERSDLDKELLGEALKDFHGAHYNQKQVDAALKAFDRAQTVVARQMQENAVKADDAAEEELRSSFLKDYKPTVELTNRYLSEILGPYMPDAAERKSFLDMRLQDGTRIGNHVPFVKAMAALARDAYDDGTMVGGETTDGVDIDKRINDITSKAHSDKPEDKREYERLQPELLKLIAAQNKRNASK